MNTKRLAFQTSVLVILLAMIAACGGAQTPTATQAPSVPQATQAPSVPQATQAPATAQPTVQSEVINLTYWDIPESDPYTKWFGDYVDKFNASHPNIHVTMEVFPTDNYKTKWVASLAANTLPDIWYQDLGPQTEAAWTQGAIQPLDTLLKTDLWNPGTIEECSYQGHVLCMPLYLAPEYIYYNKTLFAKAGVDPQKWANPQQPTWDEFTAACNALVKAGIPPLAIGNGDQWPGVQWMWSFEARFGGNQALYDAVSGQNGGAYNSAPMLKAAQYTQMLNKNGWLTPGFNGISGSDKYTMWTLGKGAMIFQGTWLLGYTQSAPAGFDFGFINFPSFPDENPAYQGLVMAGTDALFISKSSKHPEAAAEFLNGLADPQTATDFAVKTANISPIKGITAPAGHENDIIWQIGAAAAKSKYSPWWDIAVLPGPVNDAMLNLSQGLLSGDTSPQAFVDAMQKAAGR